MVFKEIKAFFEPKPYRIPKTWNMVEGADLKVNGKKVRIKTEVLRKVEKNDLAIIDLGLFTTLCRIESIRRIHSKGTISHEYKARLIPSKRCLVCRQLYEISSSADNCPRCKV